MKPAIVFLTTFAMLLGINVSLYLGARDLRREPVNFSALASGERLAPAGLTRRQFNDLTLGYAESGGRYRVGAFGTHQIRHFGRDAFGPEAARDTFFNYNMQTLGLPGIRDLLVAMEAKGTVPKDLIIVAVMTPNMHNGNYILTRFDDIPPDVTAAGDAAFGGTSLRSLAKAWLDQILTAAAETLNYQLLLKALINRGDAITRVDVDSCGADRAATALASLDDWQRTLYERVPTSLMVMFGLLDRNGHCALPRIRRMVLHNALRADGSTEWVYGAPPVLNEQGLEEATRRLRFGDEERIAEFLRQIDSIARRNGARTMVLVPPVYETDRPSAVNRILSAALAKVPDFPVIDDRNQRLPIEDFYDHRHPKRGYFRGVVERLRSLGLLKSS